VGVAAGTTNLVLPPIELDHSFNLPQPWPAKENPIVASSTARALRKRLTPQEVKLWVKLRALKPLGYHFRRQAPVGRFIVDFICFHAKLVIEADGGQHGLPDGAHADQARDSFLRSQGFRILRFWNSEIDGNLNGVMTQILCVLPPPPDPPAAGHPPHKGEGQRPLTSLPHPRR
jgi:very-short-patch-repair endonuclease